MKKAFVIKENCVACGECMKVCPFGAPSIYKGLYAIIDETKCVGCQLCAKNCPALTIKMKEVVQT